MLDIIFYSFAALALVSAVCVVSSKNPVHSVLFLILVFSLTAGLLILLNTEFLAIVYIVVYVGAIAVLFLFVVMMLNIRMTENLTGNYLPIGVLIGSIIFFQLYFIVEKELPEYPLRSSEYVRWGASVQYEINVKALSEVLYTYYVYFFILAGMILFVAMLGAIVLTLHHKTDVKRQEVYEQVGRNYTTGIIKVDLRKELEE